MKRKWTYFDRMLLALVLILQICILAGIYTRDVAPAHNALATLLEYSSNLQTGDPDDILDTYDDMDVNEMLDVLLRAQQGQAPSSNSQAMTADPFMNLDKRMDQMMKDAVKDIRMMESLFDVSFAQPTAKSSPAMDMRDMGTHYVVVFSAPGLSPEDLRLTLNGQLLTITGRGRTDDPRGAPPGLFERKVRLPGPVQDASSVQASITNGTLRVTIPKLTEQMPKEDADAPK